MARVWRLDGVSLKFSSAQQSLLAVGRRVHTGDWLSWKGGRPTSLSRCPASSTQPIPTVQKFLLGRSKAGTAPSFCWAPLPPAARKTMPDGISCPTSDCIPDETKKYIGKLQEAAIHSMHDDANWHQLLVIRRLQRPTGPCFSRACSSAAGRAPLRARPGAVLPGQCGHAFPHSWNPSCVAGETPKMWRDSTTTLPHLSPPSAAAVVLAAGVGPTNSARPSPIICPAFLQPCLNIEPARLDCSFPLSRDPDCTPPTKAAYYFLAARDTERRATDRPAATPQSSRSSLSTRPARTKHTARC